MSARIRRAFVLVALVGATLVAGAPAAAAKPPLLESVGSNNGFAGAKWSLPAGVQSQFYEVASDPERSTFGNFLQRNLLRFGVVDRDQTCMIDDGPPLAPGVYYLQVAGHDTAPGAPQVELSAAKRFVVFPSGNVFSCPSTGPGGGSGGGTGGGGTGGAGGGATVKDTDRPSCTVRYARRQRLKRLNVRARTNEPGTLNARAVVRVPGARKAIRFRTVSRQARQGRFTRLRLKLTRNNRRAALRAVRSGKRLRARVVVTARDQAGNTQRQRATISLRP